MNNLMIKLCVLGLLFAIVGAAAIAMSKDPGKPAGDNMSASDELDRRLLDAVNDDNLRKFEKLLKEGANPNRIFGKGAKDWVMCQVTDKGRLEFLKLALKHGGDMNLRNPLMAKSTVKSIFSAPLLCSIRKHNEEAFQYLLDQGVDINIKACTECKYERLHGSPITVAEHGNEYRMAMELINRRNGQLNKYEIKTLIHGIEKTTINESSDQNYYRLQMAEWLRGQGHPVTPWTGKK